MYKFFFAIFILFPLAVFAGTSDNVSGWAWSENIGWISLNSTNTASPINYGVTINAGNGKFSGYAWSETVGWLSFTSSDLAGCPSTPCETRLDFDTNQVVGWARFLAGSPAAAGWDGWVKLTGAAPGGAGAYGVIRSGSQLTGWAWGSDVVGWMKFGGTTFKTDLGSQVSEGGTITIEATKPDNTRYFGPLIIDIADSSGATVLTTSDAPTTVGVNPGLYTLAYKSGGPGGVMASVNPGSSLNVKKQDNLTATFIFTNPPIPPYGSDGLPWVSKSVSDESFFCPSTQVVFAWLYDDPNHDPQGAFELEVDNNFAFTSPELATGVIVSPDHFYINDPGKLFFNTTYYWRVRARDIDGAWSDWSLTNSFTTPESCITADFSLVSSHDIFVNIAKQIVDSGGSFVSSAQAQGKEISTSATVTVIPTKFSDIVSLSVVSGLPPGGKAFFTPSSLDSNSYSTGSQFYVEVPKDTAEGIYSLTVQGTGGGLVRSTTVLLSVIITDPRFKEF